MNENLSENFKESVSWFRKCCVEFGQDMTEDNLNRMKVAQIELISYGKHLDEQT